METKCYKLGNSVETSLKIRGEISRPYLTSIENDSCSISEKSTVPS